MKFNLFKSTRRKYKLKKRLYDQWFAAVIHAPSENFYPPAFDKDLNFIKYKVGDIVPMMKLPDSKLVYYKITKIRYQHGDWVFDSDGYKYDLKYSHVK